MTASLFVPARPGAPQPIGVFDSGYGGLSVLRELRHALPQFDYTYLGDSGRAPYGGRDLETILDFAEQCTELLFAEGCRVVIVACHTVSSVALRHLQQRYADASHRVLGVTIPAAENAVAVTRGHIGLLGTARTVASHTFRTEVHKLNDALRVTEVAAPLLAPIVEAGWENSEIARLAIREYLAEFDGADTLVLGCTHYPLLRASFEESVPAHVSILDPAPFVAARFAHWQERHPEFAPSTGGQLRVLSSGDTTLFAENGARFLGTPLPAVEHVAERHGRLVHAINGSEPTGQFVR
ncbi:MAG: glutamate racemase [Chthoniobacteraceae bacterium]